ncbi:MAG: ammonium transporter [Myxococcales bacterium]|nr:ammonium transporter [Myxococcales bacterium]
MLTSSALVLLMVPGLALFYAGMVRAKNVLSTMMHSMVALAIIGVEWVTIGYALAFGDDVGGAGLIGWSPEFVLLSGVQPGQLWPDTQIPIFVHATFQGMFAVITPALISGALAERIRFSRYCLFVALWGLLVYTPIAHWVWHPEGWLFKLDALDFAGGTVVHVAAGASALVAALMLRRRQGFPERPVHPSSAANTLFGAGLLWFGWFGFNGGSALAANTSASLAFTVTHVAAAAGALAWVLIEWRAVGKPTAIGFASGAVAGLVGITPAAGFVSPGAALLIGGLTSAACFGSVLAMTRLGVDDSLDAFGIHGVGGALGAVLTGVLASKSLYDPSAGGGWLFDGNLTQVGIQILGVVATAAFAVPVTAILVRALSFGDGFVVAPQQEEQGLDVALHGEQAYDLVADVVTAIQARPRHAAQPPVVVTHLLTVEGLTGSEVATRWQELCTSSTPPGDFTALYRSVARLQGNTFRIVGGDVEYASKHLSALYPAQVIRQGISHVLRVGNGKAA